MNRHKYFFLGIFIIQTFFVVSCQSTFNQVQTDSTSIKNTVYKPYNEEKSLLALREAKAYLGTPYKYAGTNKSGMDCSGLMYLAHKKIGIDLPRMSKEQANLGSFISIRDVKPGDLLFFNTFGSGISHTAMVESIKDNEVFFIHSSTSKGVIISSMNEAYWKSRYVTGRRMIK